ncbi:MAG TPA: ATP-binding protein [Terriglobales bacterium]|nr:ATP-binding protein [Terriglobales bacterium]
MFKQWTALKRHWTLVRYVSAVLAAWVALSIWTFSPALHRHPFSLFLAAVVVTARFFGLGPALLCCAVSTACLDFVVFLPRYSFALNTRDDAERLVVFLALAILVGSLSRSRTLAELRAERSMREMAAIVEYSDDAIYSTSPDGTILSWNRGAERLYGYTEEEAVGSPIMRLAPPERYGEIERNRETLNRGDSVESYQTERLRKDGTRLPVLLTVAPLRNREGELVGSSAIARDIFEQKLSEEVARRSEKLATAGRLAASVAHEINNPLEAVLNLLYLARNDPQRAQQYLSMAEQEVGRVARLAQQALGSVRDTNALGNLDAARIMDEILELYARKIEKKQIHVIKNYRGNANFSGYPGEVRQLLTNLLMNALDATDHAGSIHIRIRAANQAPGRHPGVRVTLSDNGTGIPSESLRRIFEPFFSTKKDAGTGLGLWVSRGIVQKHGGSIRVRSRINGPHRGTAFSIFLPSAQVATQVA